MSTFTNVSTGQTNGSTITAAGSGNSPDTAYDLLTSTGSTITPIYDNTHLFPGSLMSMKFGTTASASNQFMTKNYASATSAGALLAYFHTPTSTAIGWHFLAFCSSTTICADLSTNTSGKLTIRDTSSTATGTAGTVTLPTDTDIWVYINASVLGASGGAATAAWGLASSVTASDTASATGASFHGTADRFRIGIAANVTGALTTWCGQMQANDTGATLNPITPPATGGWGVGRRILPW